MVMALCQSSYNQGVYGLVTNLGSLVVRTIFFPVEEAAFRAFSRPPGNCQEVQTQWREGGRSGGGEQIFASYGYFSMQGCNGRVFIQLCMCCLPFVV